MSEFKVGDKVVVFKKVEKNTPWVERMSKTLGKCGFVTDVEVGSDTIGVNVVGGVWYYDAECLELVEKTEKVHTLQSLKERLAPLIEAENAVDFSFCVNLTHGDSRKSTTLDVKNMHRKDAFELIRVSLEAL